MKSKLSLYCHLWKFQKDSSTIANLLKSSFPIHTPSPPPYTPAPSSHTQPLDAKVDPHVLSFLPAIPNPPSSSDRTTFLVHIFLSLSSSALSPPSMSNTFHLQYKPPFLFSFLLNLSSDLRDQAKKGFSEAGGEGVWISML